MAIQRLLEIYLLACQGYRFYALLRVLKVCEQTSAPALVSSVWRDSENIRQDRSKWNATWKQLTDPHAAMNADQRKEFDALPEEFAVYRGFNNFHGPQSHKLGHRGLSWTTDQAKAEWFARRLCFDKDKRSFIADGRVRKEDVFAYFDGGEKEIVVHPDKVRGMVVTELEPVTPA